MIKLYMKSINAFALKLKDLQSGVNKFGLMNSSNITMNCGFINEIQFKVRIDINLENFLQIIEIISFKSIAIEI